MQESIFFTTSRRLIAALLLLLSAAGLQASSHREAPLIANDPLADNTDVYAFRSPDNPNTITIIACYIPTELPQGGPNFNTFGENIRYEIHVDNDPAKAGDEVTYRFTFTRVNQDPTTFFNIRLGQMNAKTTYTCERSTDGGLSWQTIVSNGSVPPPNIGPRSIQSAVGLGAADYNTPMMNAITGASTGEQVFCGPVDDPFFVDLGGVFDLGNLPRQGGAQPRDGIGQRVFLDLDRHAQRPATDFQFRKIGGFDRQLRLPGQRGLQLGAGDRSPTAKLVICASG